MRLLSLVVAKGINLQTNTPVTSVSSTPEGKWVVKTPYGNIKTSEIIVATNGYTAGILPEYTSKIVPCRGICGRIVLPPDSYPPQLTNTIAIRENPGGLDYLMPGADGSIIVGGGCSTYHAEPQHWYNNFDDSTLIEPAKHHFDTFMQRHLRGWEDSGAHTDKIWTGIMGYTADGLPHVGEVPGKKGLYIAAGWNGHGMPNVFLAMKGVAQMVGKGKTYEETGLPRLYRTSRERLESEDGDAASNRG